MNFRADLHCHSVCSDGSCTPSELLCLAQQANLQGLSITDHDTLSAYTPALFQEATARSVALVTGIECSSDLHGVGVHILGYGMDLHSPSFEQFLVQTQHQRSERNRQIVDKLAGKGCHFSAEEREFLHRESCGRPHIAEKLVQKGYVSSRSEAFNRYLNEDAPCFVGGYRPGPSEVIEAIHQAHGKAVLAHPGLIQPFSLCQKLLQLPFDGIECYYARLSPSQVRYWLQVAAERHWLATGGSDFHGTYTPRLALGCSWVGDQVFYALSRSH